MKKNVPKPTKYYVSKLETCGVSYKSTPYRKVVKVSDEWLKEAQAIRSLIKSGATMEFLGQKYGVSRQRMHQVIRQLKLTVWGGQ